MQETLCFSQQIIVLTAGELAFNLTQGQIEGSYLTDDSQHQSQELLFTLLE